MDEKLLWMNYEINVTLIYISSMFTRNSHHNSKHLCFLDIYHGSNMVFSPNKQKKLIKSCFDPTRINVSPPP